ncbi:MAG: ABC transporter ATP-binding protein, partial [Myxococcota bacterium]
LGGNGAGKSTTLLTLLGFLKPTSGAAFVDGYEVGEHRDQVRRKTAYLPEKTTLYPHLSAHENLIYLLALAGKKVGSPDLNSALDTVGLDVEARKQLLGTYSKGMRQKVAIALAILRDTPLLLLDEPTSGLDPVAIDDFNALLRSLADRGQTILMVTHDVYGACQVADRIGLLRKGELVGTFSASDKQRIDTESVHAAFAERSTR